MATPPPREVAVIGRAGERLTEELIRELGTAHFRVERLQARQRQAPEEALAALPRRVRRGVLVSTDTGHVIIFARGGRRLRPELARSAPLETRIDLLVNGADRFSRRRACLTVVEYLRVLAVADTLPASEDEPDSGPNSGIGHAGSTSVVTSPSGGARAPAAPDPENWEADSTELAPAERSSGSAPPRAPRTLAVGVALDLNAGIGKSTGHVQFMWRFPFTARWSIAARALWPILGADFPSGSQQLRLWSFGAGADVRYTFADHDAKVRPFAALLAGTRILLADARLPGVPTSATSVTPSATVGVSAGLSYRLTSNADAYLESGASQGWRVPALGSDTADAAAAATFFTTSVGVTFEY